MQTGTITNGQAYQAKTIKGIRCAGGFAGEMINGGAAKLACWVYVQKYVKQKTLDEMLQEWSEASQFIIVMDAWFERLMTDQ